MDNLLESLRISYKHLLILQEVFADKKNFTNSAAVAEHKVFSENLIQLNIVCARLNLYEEIYGLESRQMILADLLEYILLGRGYYSVLAGANKDRPRKKGDFMAAILHFVNLLMAFESMTVDVKLRNIYLDRLLQEIPDIGKEEHFQKLRVYPKRIGIPNSGAPDELEDYFDKLLPKTAGGLWHELLVYIFVLRNNYGYILPLLLHQRILSRDDHLVPPDFMLITYDKRIYGIEVGRKKEIQSGQFSLKTAIPSASLDTENSRNSDRCPICLKWIQFCPFVIANYSNLDAQIDKHEVRCLVSCTLFKPEDIQKGVCKYSKYSRKKAKKYPHTHHDFADGKHYHLQCVLATVDPTMRSAIIASKDTVAVKTHYPFYSGLEVFSKLTEQHASDALANPLPAVDGDESGDS